MDTIIHPPTQAPRWLLIFVASFLFIIVLLAVVLAVAYWPTSDKEDARKAALECWAEQGGDNIDIAEQRAMAVRCEKLEREFTAAYGGRL